MTALPNILDQFFPQKRRLSLPMGNDLPQDGGITGNQPVMAPQAPVPDVTDRPTEQEFKSGQVNDPSKFFPQSGSANEVPPAAAGAAPIASSSAAEDYQQASGEPLSFYPGMDRNPGGRQQKRFKQDIRDATYKQAGLDEKQRLLQSGEGPAEHSVLKRMLTGAIRGFARGGIGGMAVGTAAEGFFPGANRVANSQQELGEVNQQIDQRNKQRKADADIGNIEADNQFQQDRLSYLRDDQQRKVGDRTSRETTSRMNAVAGMFKSLPAYDPADPKFAEITKALGDVKLPVTPKDAKKKIQLIQDQRTGSWTTVLTDPATGKQETRDVVKDGKPFTSTPRVVMEGEIGLTKQDDQQKFQAGENDKNRQQALSLAKERIAIAKQNLAVAQQNADRADAKDKRDADAQVQKAKESIVRLKGYLKNSPLIMPDDDIWKDFDGLDQ
jgi:hypothetical protein